MAETTDSIFINRELSWLDFNSRVLALAKEKTVPLGERLKFAGIHSRRDFFAPERRVFL